MPLFTEGMIYCGLTLFKVLNNNGFLKFNTWAFFNGHIPFDMLF